MLLLCLWVMFTYFSCTNLKNLSSDESPTFPGFPVPSKTCRLRSEPAHFHLLPPTTTTAHLPPPPPGSFNKLSVSLQTNLILSRFSMCNFQSAAFNCICCHHVLGLEAGLLDNIIMHTIMKIKSKIGSFGSQLQGSCQITNLLPLQNSNKKTISRDSSIEGNKVQ